MTRDHSRPRNWQEEYEFEVEDNIREMEALEDDLWGDPLEEEMYQDVMRDRKMIER